MLAFLLAASLVATDPPAPVSVTLSQNGRYLPGSGVQVTVQPGADGYLLVLNADPDGRVRVLFPLDPTDDAFVKGGKKYQLERSRRPEHRVRGGLVERQWYRLRGALQGSAAARRLRPQWPLGLPELQARTATMTKWRCARSRSRSRPAASSTISPSTSSRRPLTSVSTAMLTVVAYGVGGGVLGLWLLGCRLRPAGAGVLSLGWGWGCPWWGYCPWYPYYGGYGGYYPGYYPGYGYGSGYGYPGYPGYPGYGGQLTPYRERTLTRTWGGQPHPGSRSRCRAESACRERSPARRTRRAAAIATVPETPGVREARCEHDVHTHGRRRGNAHRPVPHRAAGSVAARRERPDGGEQFLSRRAGARRPRTASHRSACGPARRPMHRAIARRCAAPVQAPRG